MFNSFLKSIRSLSWAAYILLLAQCQSPNELHSIQDYYSYLNDASHGLVQTKRMTPLEFSMKYLPVDFLAYQAVIEETNTSLSKDSLKALYAPSLHFLLKIAPSQDAVQQFDVMTETVSSMSEFKEQAFTINFDLQQLLQLQAIDKKGVVVHTLKPVLVETENTYGLTQHRLVNIVFERSVLEQTWSDIEQLKLVFKDELYETGRHYFAFQMDDLHQVPSLMF